MDVKQTDDFLGLLLALDQDKADMPQILQRLSRTIVRAQLMAQQNTACVLRQQGMSSRYKRKG